MFNLRNMLDAYMNSLTCFAINPGYISMFLVKKLIALHATTKYKRLLHSNQREGEGVLIRDLL